MAGRYIPGGSGLVMFSNFDVKGPAAVGAYPGLGPFGTYDTAGNVKEWNWNGSGELRYVLGGSSGEPHYMFHQPTRMPPFDRSESHGVRCVQSIGPVSEVLTATMDFPARDFRDAKPVNDQVFESYKGFFAYDKTPLKAVVEKVDDSPEDWRKETVTFDAAYGGERVMGRLYLPKRRSPPYQTVVYWPSGTADFSKSSENMVEETFFHHYVRSGRAVMLVVGKELFERLSNEQYERRASGLRRGRPGANQQRDLGIMRAKDLGRAIDYLETRQDINMAKLAYCGVSGVVGGTLHSALEPRIRVIVYIGAGFPARAFPPEVHPVNFAPRVRIPALMLNGRYDSMLPVETNQIPLFQLLGTPAKDKRHLIYESGHIPPRQEIIKESLAWLDKYLGPVE